MVYVIRSIVATETNLSLTGLLKKSTVALGNLKFELIMSTKRAHKKNVKDK